MTPFTAGSRANLQVEGRPVSATRRWTTEPRRLPLVDCLTKSPEIQRAKRDTDEET